MKRVLAIKSIVVAIALVAVVILAGCSGESPTSTPRPTATTAPPTPTVPPSAPAPSSTLAPTSTTPTSTTPPPTRTAPPSATPVPTSEPTAAPEPLAPQLPAQVTDVSGNQVTVTDVSRIVVMNGDFTEVVFALGLGDYVVAVDTSATYPAEVTNLPQIGYQRVLSAEGVLSMDPTVVIGSTNAGPPEVLEQIRAAGVPVVVLESVITVDGGARKIRGIAQALGVPDRGEALARKLEIQISAARALSAQAQERPTAVFLYMRGLDTLFLGGKGHLSHELFESSGAVSGGAALGVEAQVIPLTAESLAAADPDCIVVLTRGLESVGGLEGIVTIPGVGETTAAQEGCILDFDDQYFGGGGPRMGQLLMELLQAFQPELALTQ